MGKKPHETDTPNTKAKFKKNTKLV